MRHINHPDAGVYNSVPVGALLDVCFPVSSSIEVECPPDALVGDSVVGR